MLSKNSWGYVDVRISAHGANRASRNHSVANSEVRDVRRDDGEISFQMLSSHDPGIGQGQYVLTFKLSKEEVFNMFECAVSMRNGEEIQYLKEEIEDLKNQLRDL